MRHSITPPTAIVGHIDYTITGTPENVVIVMAPTTNAEALAAVAAAAEVMSPDIEEFKSYKVKRPKIRPRILPPKFLIIKTPNKHRKFRRVTHKHRHKKSRTRH